MTKLPPEADALLFSVEKSLRYHQRRRAHYDRLHKLVMFGILLCGSAAFASFFGGQYEWFGLAAAVLAALDLVFEFSHKARDHEQLFRRFTDLAVEIRAVSEPSDEDLARWQRRRLEIEADEPPIFWALEASCYNEVVGAWGRRHRGVVPLTRWQRLAMNWLRFDQEEFPEPRAPHDQALSAQS